MFITDDIENCSDDSDRENSDKEIFNEENQILKFFLEKYKNFFNIGARKFHFPKYKIFLFFGL